MTMAPGDNDINFLHSLFEATQGDGSVQVSMYELGEAMGLDKEQAAQVAEWVIGAGWAEVKTLSGGIGISQMGVEKAVSLGAKMPADADEVVKLGEEAILSDEVRKVVESVLASLKLEVVDQAFDFDAFAEIIADIRTLEMQLVSPRPKTALFRAGFESMKAVLEKARHIAPLDQINQLLD